MKVSELSKQLDITNKEVINFLKSKNYKITSHMQNVPDEVVDEAIETLSKPKTEKVLEEKKVEKTKIKETQKKNIPDYQPKKFKPDDIIACKSVVPYKLNALGVDKNKVYHWEYFGDVDYLEYRDLQALRRTEYITKPLIMIDNADLCYQWRRELGDIYNFFLGIDYPEDFFEKSDAEFERLLKEAPESIQNVIKITAMSMIKNENYPTIQKLVLIDENLGTCLKEFL